MASNAEAAEIGLALQRVIRGENLEDTNPELASKYRQYMRDIDKQADSYEEDKRGWIEDALSDGLSNRPTGSRLIEKREEVTNRLAVHRANARVKSRDKTRWMMDQLKNGPKEEIYVEGQITSGSVGGQPTSRLEGYMIRMNGVSVYLKPGNNHVHPIIADRYRQIVASKINTQKRKDLLAANSSWQTVVEGMKTMSKDGDDWDDPRLVSEF